MHFETKCLLYILGNPLILRYSCNNLAKPILERSGSKRSFLFHIAFSLYIHMRVQVSRAGRKISPAIIFNEVRAKNLWHVLKIAPTDAVLNGCRVKSC